LSSSFQESISNLSSWCLYYDGPLSWLSTSQEAHCLATMKNIHLILFRKINIFGEFSKLRNHLLASSCLTVCMSVCLSAWKNSAPNEKIFMKFDIWIFSKTSRENSSFIKICQDKCVLYMKTNADSWSYLVKLFLQWEMCQTNLYRKSKHIFYAQLLFFFLNLTVYENVKNIVESDRPQMTVCCVTSIQTHTKIM
jgi:hypothetical protein